MKAKRELFQSNRRDCRDRYDRLDRSDRHDRSERPTSGPGRPLFATAFLGLLLLPFASALNGRPPQTLDAYRSLMGRHRSVNVHLLFRGIHQVDTDESIEDRFLFRSADGVDFFVKLEWNHDLALQQVRDQNELAPFRFNHVYELDLRFERQTARGLLIVRATPAEVWELRLARKIPPYSGDITEQDPRIRDLLESLRNQNPAPEEQKLFFSRRETLYLVFYDLEGTEVKYQYRRDRWETDELKKVRFLIPGSAYRVKGGLKGLILDEKVIPQTDERFRETIQKKSLEDFYLLFDFESAEPLRTEQILY